MNPLVSLLQTGTRLWLDSIDPQLIQENLRWGATGATSNPIIVCNLIQTGRFDQQLQSLINQENDAASVAWRMTDWLVQQAQKDFLPTWNKTAGNDGYVSFELDSLLEDPHADLPHDIRVQRYIDQGVEWSSGHQNRMIKVPATPAGLEALEELAARGVPLNVTLIFTSRQYELARAAIHRGSKRLKSLQYFKSVYSIFVSRIDVYAEKYLPQLSAEAQTSLGVLNAQRIWQANQEYWQQHATPLRQEIVFASTGTKKPSDPPWKYVQRLAGSDIQTNPPETNAAIAKSEITFERHIDQLPPPAIIQDLDRTVDFQHLEATLMSEGIEKFVAPQRKLLELVEEKRQSLARS